MATSPFSSPRDRAAKLQRDAQKASLDAARASQSERQDFAAPIAQDRAQDAADASAAATQLYQQDANARQGR